MKQTVVLSKGPYTKAILVALNNIPEMIDVVLLDHNPEELTEFLKTLSLKEEVIEIKGNEEALKEVISLFDSLP